MFWLPIVAKVVDGRDANLCKEEGCGLKVVGSNLGVSQGWRNRLETLKLSSSFKTIFGQTLQRELFITL